MRSSAQATTARRKSHCSGRRLAAVARQDGERADAAVPAGHGHGGEAGAGPGRARRATGTAGSTRSAPARVSTRLPAGPLAHGAGRGQRALLVDDLPGAGEGRGQTGRRHQAQRGHGAAQVNRSPRARPARPPRAGAPAGRLRSPRRPVSTEPSRASRAFILEVLPFEWHLKRDFAGNSRPPLATFTSSDGINAR